MFEDLIRKGELYTNSKQFYLKDRKVKKITQSSILWQIICILHYYGNTGWTGHHARPFEKCIFNAW